jgi:hypothetical protein
MKFVSATKPTSMSLGAVKIRQLRTISRKDWSKLVGLPVLSTARDVFQSTSCDNLIDQIDEVIELDSKWLISL